MANDVTAFAPLYTVTGPNSGQVGSLIPSVTLAATTASQAVTLPSGNGYNQIQIVNQTTGYIYVNFGIAGSVAAATVATSFPVAPTVGIALVVTVSPEVTAATVIAAVAGNVIFTRGIGI